MMDGEDHSFHLTFRFIIEYSIHKMNVVESLKKNPMTQNQEYHLINIIFTEMINVK